MRRTGATWRTVAAQLALLAILLRAAIPLGYMPNPAGTTDGLPIVLCTSQGLVTVADGLPPEGSDPDATAWDAARTCAFASVVSLGQPSAAPALDAPLLRANALAAPVFSAPPPPARRLADASPRGPPALS